MNEPRSAPQWGPRRAATEARAEEDRDHADREVATERENARASAAPGVFVYQITDTGLAAQITATGQKFYKDDALN